jgi:hypothetical protein
MIIITLPQLLFNWGYFGQLMLKFNGYTFILAIICSTTANAGWGRISNDVIELKGDIEDHSYNQYLAVSKGGYKKILLHSEGGQPAIALMIAEDIYKQKPDIEVQGYCLSACANYLALAGKSLHLPCGSILGWHGSPFAVTDDQVRSDHKIQGFPPEFTENYIEKWHAATRSRERAFFEKIGVDHRLITDSVLIPRSEFPMRPQITSYTFNPVTGDVSMSISREEAPLWIPTKQKLKSYGVPTANFCGRYDRDAIKNAIVKNSYIFKYTSSDNVSKK